MARNKNQGRQSKKRNIDTVSSASSSSTKLPRADSENTHLRKAIAAVQASDEEKSSTAAIHPVFAPALSGKASIFGEYACMLNQTDVINNNNKFYVIQLAHDNGKFILFTHWGRVGELGQHDFQELDSEDEATKAFKKKFQSKTGNNWEKRVDFLPRTKKYTLLAMDTSEGWDVKDSPDTGIVKKESKNAVDNAKCPPCSLDIRTQLMVKLIFNADMFVGQMAEMNLDVKKMPLGKLSKSQIAKGLEALIEIEEAIKNKASQSELATLSSKFFTLIPHSFGRQRPPVLSSLDVIRQKKDVMITLSDIELTQSLQKEEKDEDAKNPLDANYESLHCKMELLDKNSKEYKIINQYITATTPTGFKLLDVWCLDREGESERFRVNNELAVRKLLWHGTNVAVVAAIVNSGLRIMPHSGGLVGKGIYFASEHSKSAGYVCAHYGDFEGEQNVCFMFLVEVALGRMKEIEQCDHSIKKAPAGFDSVVARGRNEPDLKKDVTITLDGRPVTVPVGKPIPQPKFANSNFFQSEYLVYNEHQARMRFLLKFSRT